MRLLQWLRAKDAGLSATRRAGRAAVVMPSRSRSPSGARQSGDRDLRLVRIDVDRAVHRLQRYQARTPAGPVSLIAAGLILISIGTVASIRLARRHRTLIVAFIIFSSASSARSSPARRPPSSPLHPPGQPPRRGPRSPTASSAGYSPAPPHLWPSPSSGRPPPANPSAARPHTPAPCSPDASEPASPASATPRHRAHRRTLASIDEASDAVAALRKTFFGTPYRPTGLSTSAAPWFGWWTRSSGWSPFSNPPPDPQTGPGRPSTDRGLRVSRRPPRASRGLLGRRRLTGFEDALAG